MGKEDINYLYDRYSLDNNSKKKLNKIILPIISHSEFKKRMTNLFPHHGNVSLGEHIIEDAIVTYQLGKRKEKINLDLAIKIAMFHDLYTLPWQNNKESKELRSRNQYQNKNNYLFNTTNTFLNQNMKMYEFDDPIISYEDMNNKKN